MKTITKVLTLFVALTFAQAAYSQTYNSAIGLRFGYPTSVSYKKFFKGSTAFEGIVGFRGYTGYSWINIAAALQKHNAISSTEGLSWYYGAGAGVYLYSFDFATTESSTSFGVSGYLGLDYKFADIPLNLSVDWVPTFFLSGYGSGFGGGYGGLSARYVLK